MSYHHLIDNALLALNFDNAATKQAFEQQAGRFVQDRLLPMVERVFDRFAKPEQKIVIDILELDLGVIRGSDYLVQIENKLDVELSKKLTELVDGGIASSGEKSSKEKLKVRQLHNDKAHWHQLEHFLLHGYMPWNFNYRLDANNTWLEETIANNVEPLIKLLKNGSRSQQVIERLVNQMGWSRLHAVDPRISVFIDRFWLANGENTVQSFAGLLTEALVDGRLKPLKQQWPTIIAEHGPLLLQLLRFYGQKRRVRHSVARKFTPSMLSDTLLLLEPLEYPFIEQLIHRAEIFVPQSLEQELSPRFINQLSAEQIAQSKTHLWEFTLGYLLVERGSRFNRKTYLASVLGQMAAHHNMSKQQMLSSIMASLAQIDGSAKLQSDLQVLLAELAEEILTEGDLQPEWHLPSVQSDIAIPELNSESVASESTLTAQSEFTLWLTQALLEGDGKRLSPHWQEIIAKQSQLLVKLLRYYGQQSQVRQRLVSGFESAMLKDMVIALEPTEHQFVEQVVDSSPSLFHPQFAQLPEKTRSSAIWLFIFTYLLAERGSTFNRKSFVTSVIKQMAAHRNLVYEDLLQSLFDSIDNISIDSTLKTQLKDLLRALCLEADLNVEQASEVRLNDSLLRGLPDELSESFSQSKDFNQQLISELQQLSQAMRQGDAKSIIKWWNAITHQQNQQRFSWLRKILLEQGMLAQVRGKLAVALPDEILLEMVETISSPAKKVVKRMLEQLPWLAAGLSLGQKPSNKQTVGYSSSQPITAEKPDLSDINLSSLKQSFWEFTLTYLLVERGGQFNKQSYLASLIKQMAAHRNLSYQALLGALLQVLEQAQWVDFVSQSDKHELTIILRELLKTEGQEESHQTTQEHNITHLYQYYWQIKAVLEGKVKPATGKVFERQLKGLLSAYPVLLQSLFKGLTSEQIDWHQLALRLELSQLKLLVSVFTAITSGQEALSNSPMAQATEQYLSQLDLTEQKQRFLQLLLSAMGERQPVDLESFFEAANAIEQIQISLPVDSIEDEPTEIEINNEISLEQQLIYLLERINLSIDATHADIAAVSAKDIKALKSLLKALVKTSDSHWQQWIRPILSNDKINEKLFDWLQGDLLYQLIIKFKPNDFRQMQSALELLTTSVFALIDAKDKSHLEALKWQFVYRQLLVHGVPFETNRFVEHYLDFLRDKLTLKRVDAQTGQDTFYQALVMQLLAHQLPSSQRLTQVIVTQVKKLAQHRDGPDEPDEKVSNDETAAENQRVDLPSDVQAAFGSDGDTVLAQARLQQVSPENKVLSPGKPWKTQSENESAISQTIYVGNAGLILTTPYIPRLLAALEITKMNHFVSEDDKQTALHLLQYTVTGQQATREYQLVLNKLMLGMKTAKPVKYGIEITDKQKNMIEGMLKAITQHWTPLKNTTVEALRETFLQRDGTLTLKGNQWSLQVEGKTFDMLLDQLPWSYNLIKTPWMDNPLNVQWR